MAIANIFDKTALNASQVLTNYNPEVFRNILLSHRILIEFDEEAVQKNEARLTLDLLVRLLARLYPYLAIRGQALFADTLYELARLINPAIEGFEPNEATIKIIIGNSSQTDQAPAFYVGSNGWIAGLSDSTPVGSEDSGNPFGAGGAACLGAANIFRLIFREQLPYGATDKEVRFSMLDFESSDKTDNPVIYDIALDETLLVGLGAIGNSVIWTLGNVRNLSGKLILVDKQTVSLSNLQRYVLALQADIEKEKVSLTSGFLHASALMVEQECASLEEYMLKRNNWNIKRIGICVDNSTDRIIAQGILPEKIFNAWTQPENIGVSRHVHFSNEPCLSCLYYPITAKKSLSQEVADNLGLSGKERKIREYLANNTPVDISLLFEIAVANQIDPQKLFPFVGKSIIVFYSEVVCGGVLLSLNPGQLGVPDTSIEVPAAFESAMAGILLAAEFIREKMGVNLPSTTTQFNLMRPFSSHLNIPVDKKAICICNDPVYRATYNLKWRTAV